MTVGLERFEQIIDAYGGDPGRWPPDERQEAEALMAVEPRARSLAESARRLDEWLAQSEAPSPSDLLTRRVLKAAPRPMHVLGWASGAGWAAAAAAGLFIGLSLGEQFEVRSQAYEGINQAMTWTLDEAEDFG